MVPLSWAVAPVAARAKLHTASQREKIFMVIS
jgi:hypothetical protein